VIILKITFFKNSYFRFQQTGPLSQKLVAFKNLKLLPVRCLNWSWCWHLVFVILVLKIIKNVSGKKKDWLFCHW